MVRLVLNNSFKESLNKLISFISSGAQVVRYPRHEQTLQLTVRLSCELVERSKDLSRDSLKVIRCAGIILDARIIL